jgi:HPt (histidine-containing phosphotransfer) domain-containing protein
MRNGTLSLWFDAPDGPGGGLHAVDYTRLRDLSMTLEDGLREVVDAYLEDTPRLIEAMRSAFAGADWPDIQRLAHSLKSSSGIFGAQRMVALCAALETAAREQSPGCVMMIEDAGVEFRRIAAALDDYIHPETRRE